MTFWTSITKAHTRLWKCGFETGALDGVFFMKCLLWMAFLNGVFQHVHRPPSEATALCSFNPSQVAFDIETVDLLDRSDGITPKNFSRVKLFLVFSWYFPCIFNIGMSGVFWRTISELTVLVTEKFTLSAFRKWRKWQLRRNEQMRRKWQRQASVIIIDLPPPRKNQHNSEKL